MTDVRAHRANWLVNTCLLGLLPVLARLVVWSLYNSGVEPLATSDFIAFGLVLHSANINEVNRIAGDDESWHIKHNGISIIFIVVYALILFGVTIPSKEVDTANALRYSLGLSVVSFLISATVFFRARSEAGPAI